MDHVAVRLVVEHLVAPKRLRVLYLDQHVPAPSCAVRLVVRDAPVDAPPVSSSEVLGGQAERVALVDGVELVLADR